MIITVNCAAKTINWKDQRFPCRIGRDGFIDAENGKEGDGKTPLGQYHLRFGLYRQDRLPGPPPSELPFWPLQRDDGWCDDVKSDAYNRFIKLPFSGSHEVLWREDGAYDVILVMSHNDSPPQKGLGSAVFIHIAQLDERQTLGCVALTPNVMVSLLRDIAPQTEIHIKA